MSNIELRFSQAPRNGKVSLWVNELNIWDINQEECTPDVLKAIQSAVERGALIYRRSLELPRALYVDCDGKFESRAP